MMAIITSLEAWVGGVCVTLALAMGEVGTPTFSPPPPKIRGQGLADATPKLGASCLDEGVLKPKDRFRYYCMGLTQAHPN